MPELPDPREPGGRKLWALTLLLGFAGGFTDAGGFMLAGVFTGHVTGPALLTMIYLARHDFPHAISAAIAAAGFVAGTALGVSWQRGTPPSQAPRQLAGPLAGGIVLVALGTAVRGGSAGTDAFVALVALSMGLRNGAWHRLGGITVYSTFVTGMTTQLVSALPPECHQAQWTVLPAMLACFLAGAGAGAWLTHGWGSLGFLAVLLPMLVALVLSLAVRPPDPSSR
jgi:uncharacterized membrane protein YoaK (UPF0700 family)